MWVYRQRIYVRDHVLLIESMRLDHRPTMIDGVNQWLSMPVNVFEWYASDESVFDQAEQFRRAKKLVGPIDYCDSAPIENDRRGLVA